MRKRTDTIVSRAIKVAAPSFWFWFVSVVTCYTVQMDISKMIAELRSELDGIDEAIAVLARLASGRGRRRGRPPLWMKGLSEVRGRGRPPGSKNKPKEE
jgi:hypothetical protein